MLDLRQARTKLLRAWEAHDAYGLRLTHKYQALIDQFQLECKRDENGRPIGEPRKPKITFNEGVRETDALVAAETIYADILGINPTHLGHQRSVLRRSGLSRAEALGAIETDPERCRREPDYWNDKTYLQSITTSVQSILATSSTPRASG